MKTLLTLIVLMPLAAAGCNAVGLMSVAEHRAALGVIKAAEANEGQEYLSWAKAIAKQGGAAALPDLSAYTQEQRDAWYRARETRRAELEKVLGQ